MIVSVAGTGFASFICIKYLLSIGIKPVVFDLDNNISDENKLSIKTNSIIKEKNFDKFLCLGGLSNIWTGVLEKYLESDFSKWPFKKADLEPFYNEIFKFLDFAETYSFYGKSNDELINYNIKKTNGLSSTEIYKDQKLSLKFSSLLTNKLNHGEEKNCDFYKLTPLNLKKNIRKLVEDSKIDFRKEKICKVSEKQNQVIIETTSQTNQKRELICDYLFVGCGAISTYLIMKNSFNNFNNKLKIKSTKKIVVPVKFRNLKNFEKKFFNLFPVFQINALNNENLSVYSQIYNLNPNVINYIFPKIKKFKNYLFLLNFFKNFGFSYFSLGSDFSDEFIIDGNKNVKIYEKKYKFSELVSLCGPLFDKTFFEGQIFHLNIPIKMNALSGNHFGSIFPMTKNKNNFFDSDILGRIGNFKKISITDSSVFSSLSSRPPTLTVMANSLRITQEVSKSNFFKM